MVLDFESIHSNDLTEEQMMRIIREFVERTSLVQLLSGKFPVSRVADVFENYVQDNHGISCSEDVIRAIENSEESFDSASMNVLDRLRESVRSAVQYWESRGNKDQVQRFGEVVKYLDRRIETFLE